MSYKGSLHVNEKSYPIVANGKTFKIWCSHCGVWHIYDMVYQGDEESASIRTVHAANTFDNVFKLKKENEVS